MSQTATPATDRETSGTLHVSRAEAQIILDALRALTNLRRFSFKEPGQDPRELYGDVADTLEHVQDEVERVFGKMRAPE